MTDMDRFYELMDFITGGPTSEASLAACDLYAAALARVAELEAAARWHRGYPTEAGDYVVRRADSTLNEARYYTDGHHWGALNADIVRWAYMPQEPTP